MSWYIDELLRQAEDAQRRGELTVARRCLEEAVAIDDREATTWARLGSVCHDLEQYTAAIDAFNHALALNPTFAGAHSGLALALEAVGRVAEAEEAMRRSVELRPVAARFVLLGDLQVSRARLLDAEQSFRQALRLEPNNPEALFNLAAAIRQRSRDEAMELFARASEYDPEYADAFRELGWELLQRRKFGAAKEALERARQLNCEDPRTVLYIGVLLRLSNDVVAAAAEFERATHLAPLWSLPHLLLAKAREELGSTTDADRHYRNSLALAPEDSIVLLEVARFRVRQGQHQDARELLAMAVRANPEDVAAKQLLSELI